MKAGVEDLDVGGRLDITGSHSARATGIEAQGDRLIALHSQDNVFEVEDDVGDVFFDTGQRRELVQGVVEAHLGDSCARYR